MSTLDEAEARLNLANAILEYAADYYNEYETYSHSHNRRKHIPYIFKALIIDNPNKIGDMLQCQDGIPSNYSQKLSLTNS